MCHCNELLPHGYMDPNFQFDKDFRRCTFKYVYTLGGICYYFFSNKGSHLSYQVLNGT